MAGPALVLLVLAGENRFDRNRFGFNDDNLVIAIAAGGHKSDQGKTPAELDNSRHTLLLLFLSKTEP